MVIDTCTGRLAFPKVDGRASKTTPHCILARIVRPVALTGSAKLPTGRESRIRISVTTNYREPVGGVWDGGVVPGDVVAATPKRCLSVANYSGKFLSLSALLKLKNSWEAGTAGACGCSNLRRRARKLQSQSPPTRSYPPNLRPPRSTPRKPQLTVPTYAAVPNTGLLHSLTFISPRHGQRLYFLVECMYINVNNLQNVSRITKG